MKTITLIKGDNMKKLSVFLIALLCVLMFSVVAYGAKLELRPPEVFQEEGFENGSEEDSEIGYEAFKNPHLQFSKNTKIHDGVMYLTITSIGGYDKGPEIFWADFQLARLVGVKKAVVFMNSPGGSVFDGMALCDELRLAKKDGIFIEIHARGIIASAAVPIFLVGNKRIASQNTTFMLHPAALFKGGMMFSKEGLQDLQAQSEMILLQRKLYINTIVNNSKMSKDEALRMTRIETWFGVERAKKFGFVDEIR